MSLLNITSDGLPNILVQLHATVLRANKPVPVAELLEHVAPAEFVDDDGHARNTLNRWIELGLFINENELVSARAPFPARRASALELLAFTRRSVCRLAFSEENNTNLWAAKSAQASDLTRSLAWMLAQDAYRTVFSELETMEPLQIVDSDRQLMRNPTRKTGLHYWARFLGFSREPFACIDPTVAVRDALPEILESGEEMPATQFLDRLSEVLPVLDGGRWQEEVLSFVDQAYLPRRPVGQISTALSRALLNLRQTGELLLQPKADFGSSLVLTGAGGVRSDLAFQWVARPGKGEKV